jgi:hypothetical protein
VSSPGEILDVVRLQTVERGVQFVEHARVLEHVAVRRRR